MLVLSRKLGQRIVIDDRITVVVLEVSGDRIKLGFEAPAEVPIHRSEVHERIAALPAVAQCP
jgi:carbon storage regulator